MRKLSIFLQLFITWLILNPASALTINGAPPTLKGMSQTQAARILGSGWLLYLDGDIELDSGQKFEAYLKANNVPAYTIVVLNSMGGSATGGMDLGRIIRKYGFETSVGRQSRNSDPDVRSTQAGECYSACVFAYMGGKFRYLAKDSKLGVHRFYFKEKVDNAADIAQIATAAMVNYLSEMDIDPNFISIMTLASGKEIYEPKREVLEQFNVVNNGFTKTHWSFQNADSLIYLKGERDTRYGINKFILTCGNGPALYIIFDPQNREEEVKKMTAQTLVINGLYFPLPPAEIVVQNGWINATYPLTSDLVQKLYNAKSVGVIFQYNKNAPIFLGFDAMPFEGAVSKLDAIFKSCRRATTSDNQSRKSDSILTCSLILNKSNTNVRYVFRQREGESFLTEIEFEKNGTKEYTNSHWSYSMSNDVLALNYLKDTRYNLLVSLKQSGYTTLTMGKTTLGSGQCSLK